MIEHNWFCEHSVLEVRPVGTLQEGDFQLLAGQVDPILAEYGPLVGLLVDGSDFAGWQSFASLVAHCRFIRDGHRHIHKVAVVSDHTLLGFMPRLVDHFVGAEVRPFALAERERALDWLCGAG